MASRQSLRSILDVSAFEEEDAPSSIDLPNLCLRRAGSTRPPKPRVRVGPQVRGRLLSPRSLMAAPPRSYTYGSRAAGPGSEECGSEEQLGPGEIGQLFLHGHANRLPRTAHDPLIYGGERPHNCGSELR